MSVDALIPYAHVADVQRSIDFYELLGLGVVNTHTDGGRLVWAFVMDPNEGARLMLALAGPPVDPAQQAVLFYCWSPDVVALRTGLAAAGVAVGAIEHPFYMPAGELRVSDPDGYVVLVGQLSQA